MRSPSGWMRTTSKRTWCTTQWSCRSETRQEPKTSPHGREKSLGRTTREALHNGKAASGMRSMPSAKNRDGVR
eukprot:45025-Eustigmatos_ZCMA.PRE.1